VTWLDAMNMLGSLGLAKIVSGYAFILLASGLNFKRRGFEDLLAQEQGWLD